MSKQCRLTTIDNPFSPFDDFKNWFLFDEEHNYHTCAYLSRIARTSDVLTDYENDLENERAIDEIIANDFIGIYMKVYSSK